MYGSIDLSPISCLSFSCFFFCYWTAFALRYLHHRGSYWIVFDWIGWTWDRRNNVTGIMDTNGMLNGGTMMECQEGIYMGCYYLCRFTLVAGEYGLDGL